MGRLIGIDLGTTNSVAAVVDGPQPRVLENREAKTQTRSVVGLKRRRGGDGEGEVIVGEVALDNWPTAPEDTIISVKRLMGRAATDAEVEKVRRWSQFKVVAPSDGTKDSVRVVMGGKEYSPVDISALVLKKIKDDAEFRLGEEVTHAVITVPAYFSQIQRAATRKAGLKAGLKVIKVLDEPTAAAIAFGMDVNDPTPRTLLVYDLGGGTFDISVLTMAGSVFATLNLEGDMWLGGDNLDEALVRHVIAQVKKDYGLDPSAGQTKVERRFMAELKKACQRAKEQLSSSRSADIMVTGVLQTADGDLIDVDVTVTRDEFERMILPLVGRYRECRCGQANCARDTSCARCGAALGPARDGRALELVRKAMQNASLTVDQVDYVLMAGNSTTVPLVQQTMEELFGAEKVLRKVHPKHAVALGAALMAAWLGETTVCPSCGEVNPEGRTACTKCGTGLALEEPAPMPTADLATGDLPTPRIRIGVVSHAAPVHYGAQSAGDRFTVFVRKGDPYPTEERHAEVFHTGVPNQRMVSIPIFGGENLDKASANEKQGEAFAVLPPNLPQRTPVRIKLWLDADGVFELSAYLEDGTDLRPWVVAGEKDARVIEVIERAHARIGEKAAAMSAARRDESYARLDKVFARLRAQEFDAAIAAALELEQWLESPGADEGAEERPGQLVAFTGFILQQYGWAFSPAESQALNRLVAEVNALAAKGAKAAAAAADRLEQSLNGMPPLVQMLLVLRAMIMQGIQPRDPARAQGLMRRLEETEELLRRKNQAALANLEALASEIGPIDGLALPTGVGGVRCPQCQAPVPPGVRACRKCGYDTWKIAHTGEARR